MDSGQAPMWYNYTLCGFKGVIEEKASSQLKGLIFHTRGTIPPSAGLSSSSALVCAGALSLNVVLKVSLNSVCRHRSLDSYLNEKQFL